MGGCPLNPKDLKGEFGRRDFAPKFNPEATVDPVVVRRLFVGMPLLRITTPVGARTP